MAQRPTERDGTRQAAWFACLGLGWMLVIGFIYFFPAGLEGLSDPTLQTLSPRAIRLRALALDAIRIGAALAVFGAAWGFGWSVLTMPAVRRRLRAAGHTRLERVLTAVGLGLGILSTVALGLAGVRQLRPAVLNSVVAVGLGLLLWQVFLRRRRLPRRAALTLDPGEWAVAAVMALAAGFGLIGALAPEVEYDAVWYHLDFAQRHLTAGTIADDVCQYVSPYPWGTELLFSYGLVLDGPVTAKLVHFGFGVLATLATYELAKRLAGRRAGLFAAAMFAVTPMVLWESTTAYIDLATAFFVLLALMWVLRYAEQRSLPVLVLAGLFLGFALSTKHLAVIAAVPLALIVLAASRSRGMPHRFGMVTLFTVVAILPALPWYIRAQALAGNPFFPTLYDVFGADPRRWTDASNAGLERFNERFGQGHGIGALGKLPWSTTMHGGVFGGSLGIAYLMLVPLAISRRLPRGLLLVALFSLGYLALWASPISALQLRFVVPVLGPIAVLGGYGLNRVATHARAWQPAAGFSIVFVGLVALVLSLPPFLRMHERDRSGYEGYLTHVLREVPTKVVTGAESEQQYLARRIPAYGAVSRLNQLAGPKDTVVVSADPFVDLYATPRTVPDFAVCLGQAGLGIGGAADHRALQRVGVTYVLVEERLRAGSVVQWYDENFARRYLDLVYQDEKARLYRVRPTPGI